LKPFIFCPACSARLSDPGDEGKLSCPSCDRIWYRASAPTAGAAIVRDGKALVSRRGSEPKKGKFDVPGGFLLPGEKPIEGLKREVREETGAEIDVSIDDCLQIVPHTYGDENDYVLSIGFKARLVSGEPKPDDDVAELRWVTEEELEDLDFAWEHDRELFRKALGLEKGERDG
jgi:ADP-ribose pyrophosphatase YjhB (NUDIX family)